MMIKYSKMKHWDGLKGIVTNNETLSPEELIQQYSNLWQVEESFRITKHDLKIRQILLSVQTSILYDTSTNKKFAFASRVSDAKKIYKLMEVPVITRPSILK
ncbi:MAG TPA: hypothetical protein EYH11_04240 [Sulfurimonas autotrophica]|nr:hypothetical protein [Sulfurimonas autotrophica]